MSAAETESGHIFETRRFRMERSRLSATLLVLYGKWTLVILGIITIGLLCCGILFDVRWVIVALMVIFIVSPAILCYLYFFHGFRKSTVVNSIPHTLIFTPDALIAKVLKRIEEDESTKEEATVIEDQISKKEERSNGEEKFEEHYRLTFPYGSIKSCIPGRQGYIISLLAPEKGFLWMPYDAFPNQQDLTEVTAHLRKKLSE